MKTIYDSLNDRQREAVFHTEGPLLILAGAGSGKTRVLMHRIVYLVEEKGVQPYHICAITFTNKAAGEMRERIDRLLTEGAEQVWVATFHSTCVRILRRFIDRIGYDTNFSIYDGDDQKTLIKKICKDMQIDSTKYKPAGFLSYISSYKDSALTPEEAAKEAADHYSIVAAKVFERYERELKRNNALDFDDLILKTIVLFEKDKDVLSYYQERFRYIMVDEYQDTNTAQFRLVSLLAEKYKNLCVVGDDDQSIYKFRGANIQNILDFEKIYKTAKVVKLEQNYRSMGHILAAANHVIRHNRGRKDKTLWTAKEAGSPIRIKRFETAQAEADFIVREILQAARPEEFGEYAVLYRTNAQSRLLEERCVALGLPYQLVGGVNFYQRKEIKDILAILKTISNGRDDLALLRIINIPKRGIGVGTIAKLSIAASERGVSLYDACMSAHMIPGLGKAKEKILAFVDTMEGYRRAMEEHSTLEEVIRLILSGGYEEYLMTEGEVEGETRLENIEELIGKAKDYAPKELDTFLEDTTLMSDLDNLDSALSRITLMTLHGAKGLEFREVYLTGMEEGLFPSSRSMFTGDPSDMEEERRLCYVGITRAKERLTMTSAKSRMLHGEVLYTTVSQFIKEIPDECIDVSDAVSAAASRKPRDPSPVKKVNPFNPFAPENGFGSAPPAFGKTFEIKKADKLLFTIGDRVRSAKFGEGEVLAIVDGKKDYEVTVNFDASGVKKMLAGFAKLEKI